MISSATRFINGGVSVVIPTYQREQVLLDTVNAVAQLVGPLREILLIDQTPLHDPETILELNRLQNEGLIRWIRFEKPSIPHAMNVGLKAAENELVLFLDDDIIPDPQLIEAHAAAHSSDDVRAVVGQVLQPEQRAEDVVTPPRRRGLCADFDFPFNSMRPASLANVMAGNLSVKRSAALASGGFDENFVGVAYRFETEFARRLLMHGGTIEFCPQASIRHLRAERGGTRSTGSHLTSAAPKHGVGDYYFAMRCGETWLERLAYMSRRPIREVATKFHLRHPWYIPVKLLGEFRALCWAIQLQLRGPALIRALTAESPQETPSP